MKTNRTSNTARDAQVIAGIEKHLKNVSSLSLAGSTFTPADIVRLLQSRLDSVKTIATTRAQWRAAVAEDRALNTRLTPVVRAVRQYLINAFGPASPVLADFGFAPTKRAVLTPEERVAAALKAKATRAARHTMGKVQKKSIKGTVPAAVSPTREVQAAPATATPSPLPSTSHTGPAS